MISDNAIMEYKRSVGNGIFRAEPGDGVVIESDGDMLIVPDDETDEAFLNMLTGLETTGINVFARNRRKRRRRTALPCNKRLRALFICCNNRENRLKSSKRQMPITMAF